MSQTGLRNSIGLRLAIVVFMTFLLLIPSFMISLLISERQERRDTVAGEISANWGAKQTLIGPVLDIPFNGQLIDDPKNPTSLIRYAHFLPKHLDVNGIINPEVRNRGIYDFIVYNCVLDINAAFDLPQFDELGIEAKDIMWDNASVSFGISDMKGVKDPISIIWNGVAVEANPGVPSNDLIPSGISVPVKITPEKTGYALRTKLNINGSFGLLFSPIGKETSVHLSSAWPNPSFTGDYLPTNRELSEKGFQSDWRVLHVSRDFPQMWTGPRYNVNESLFGVSLLPSVDQYHKTTRTVKYAIMFIALTFLTFFVMEILSGKPIHPIQYLLVGLALLVFYTLLLSLSEYVEFGYAYTLASAAVVGLITLYSTSFLADRLRSAIVAIVLIVLYGYLYIVLQMQDYALLMGSLVLFVALALMMYLTRKVDWFSPLNHGKTDE